VRRKAEVVKRWLNATLRYDRERDFGRCELDSSGRAALREISISRLTPHKVLVRASYAKPTLPKSFVG